MKLGFEPSISPATGPQRYKIALQWDPFSRRPGPTLMLRLSCESLHIGRKPCEAQRKAWVCQPIEKTKRTRKNRVVERGAWQSKLYRSLILIRGTAHIIAVRLERKVFACRSPRQFSCITPWTARSFSMYEDELVRLLGRGRIGYCR